jgi:hypothetical protein
MFMIFNGDPTITIVSAYQTEEQCDIDRAKLETQISTTYCAKAIIKLQ